MHLPGHEKLSLRERRLREGIPVARELYSKLNQLAVQLNVAGLTENGDSAGQEKIGKA
jgi:LDH2 family malate/lactate/ureidoglycolate dehydrogenase